MASSLLLDLAAVIFFVTSRQTSPAMEWVALGLHLIAVGTVTSICFMQFPAKVMGLFAFIFTLFNPVLGIGFLIIMVRRRKLTNLTQSDYHNYIVGTPSEHKYRDLAAPFRGVAPAAWFGKRLRKSVPDLATDELEQLARSKGELPRRITRWVSSNPDHPMYDHSVALVRDQSAGENERFQQIRHAFDANPSPLSASHLLDAIRFQRDKQCLSAPIPQELTDYVIAQNDASLLNQLTCLAITAHADDVISAVAEHTSKHQLDLSPLTNARLTAYRGEWSAMHDTIAHLNSDDWREVPADAANFWGAEQ
ncbi:MAG: hypothetical protein AAF226_01370 [Verrucomicrobiota bacterium]